MSCGGYGYRVIKVNPFQLWRSGLCFAPHGFNRPIALILTWLLLDFRGRAAGSLILTKETLTLDRLVRNQRASLTSGVSS